MIRTLCAAAAALMIAACGAEEAAKTGDAAESATSSERLMARVTTRQDTLNAEQRAELEGVLRQYLDEYASNLAQGFQPTPGLSDEIVPLQPLEEHTWRVNLERGVSYRIIGACDNECDNVDLRLFDASGAELGSDVMEDDYPLVNITPATAGPHDVRIILKTCTIAPCYVAARVLRAG
ncbi:MAG: hypothetical protein GC189_14010 [Alphaproteobacteria bacterium]|nr:hypothetical protein [Alphaproteobacteria bacterium]